MCKEINLVLNRNIQPHDFINCFIFRKRLTPPGSKGTVSTTLSDGKYAGRQLVSLNLSKTHSSSKVDEGNDTTKKFRIHQFCRYIC